VHACQRVNELLTCGRVCTRETALEAEESKCWVPPPPEPEPSELVPKTPYSCKIGLRQLADTLDDIRKAAKRQPLIIDLSGNAQTFLRLVFCALLSACLQRLPGAHARTGRACVPLTNSLCVMPGLERCIPQDLYVPYALMYYGVMSPRPLCCMQGRRGVRQNNACGITELLSVRVVTELLSVRLGTGARVQRVVLHVHTSKVAAHVSSVCSQHADSTTQKSACKLSSVVE